jgi:hypothetical protein
MRREKDKLKKAILQQEQQYDRLPLEEATLQDYESLLDSL